MRGRLQLLPNRDSRDRETTAEIGLHEDAEHKPALFFRQMARTRADSAFPSKGSSALARSDRAFLDGSGACFLQGALDVFWLDVKSADIVQPSIIRFADNRIHACNIFIARQTECPIGQGCGCLPNAQGICQHNGCLYLPEFVDLRGADEFTESVVNENRACNFVLKDIFPTRQDCRDASANVFTLRDCDLANQHACYVRDGVLRSGIIDAGPDSQFACSRPVFGEVRCILCPCRRGPERRAENEQENSLHRCPSENTTLDWEGTYPMSGQAVARIFEMAHLSVWRRLVEPGQAHLNPGSRSLSGESGCFA